MKKPKMETDETKSPMEKLINLQIAAKLIGVTPVTLGRLARKGDIPAIRIGRVWRFRPSSLERRMDELEAERKGA